MVYCHWISLLFVTKESFSITSKWCFRRLVTLPESIFLGETLKCYYVFVGQLPQIGNGNEFWHLSRGPGIMITLATKTIDSMSEKYLLCFSFFLFVSLCMKEWKLQFLSGKCPTCPQFTCSFNMFFLFYFSILFYIRAMDIQHGDKLFNFLARWTYTHTP